jgi:predicted NAD/FAD-binding protein
VVGAGIGGVSAAIRLQEKGYEVTVYESAGRIGGKCYTRDIELNAETLSYDMGAAVVAISFRNLLRFARTLGEQTKSASPYRLLHADGEISSLRERYVPKGASLRLLSQFLRYARHVRLFYRRHVSRTGYKDNISEEYLVSFDEYCRKHQMEDLMAWFDLPLAAWGYGDPEEIPVWYVFGEVDFTGLLGLFTTVMFGQSNFIQGLSNGYGNLVRSLAEHEGLNVQTDSAVLSIQRRSDGVTIKTGRGNEEFDYVVISAPEVGKLLSNPSEDESAFLRDLKYAPYTTALCTVDRNVGAKLIVAQNLRKINAVRMVAAQHEDRPLVVCYARIDENSTEAEVRELISRDLMSLGIGLIDVHEIRLWKNYFPHFSTYDGYKSLLASQGRNRTVYIGSINRFESTESAIAPSINLIDLHFGNLTQSRQERFTGLRNIYHMLR